MELSKAAADLVNEYRRSPGVEPLVFTRTDTYREFLAAAAACGWTGPDVETDVEFAERRPEWVANADEEALRRWIHTVIRSDRWNGDYPDAVWMACRSGSMSELVRRLAG